MSRWLDDRDALAGSRAASLAAAPRWQASEPYRALAARFDAVDACDEEAVVAVAADLLADPGWVAALIAPLVDALAEDPAFEPPLKVHRDGLRIGVGLFDHSAVAIGMTTLSADAAARAPAPQTVVLPGRLAVVRYHRAGGAGRARRSTQPSPPRRRRSVGRCPTGCWSTAWSRGRTGASRVASSPTSPAT